MKYYLIVLWFSVIPLFAQSKIVIPEDLEVEVINYDFEKSSRWFDSLRFEAKNNIVVFELGACHIIENFILTRLRVPQTLNVEQVIRQVILYYSAHDPDTRRIERVLVYPFFTPISGPPFMSCELKNEDIFNFIYRKWHTVSIQKEPTDVDSLIYADIIRLSSEEIHKFGSMPDEIISQIAKKNELPFAAVRSIYQYITLWNSSLKNMYK